MRRTCLSLVVLGVLAGCGSDGSSNVGLGPQPGPSVTPSFSPTASPSPNTPDPTSSPTPPAPVEPALSLIQSSVLLRVQQGGSTLLREASVTLASGDLSSVTLSVTLVGPAQLQPQAGVTLGPDQKTATIVLQNTNLTEIEAVLRSLKATPTELAERVAINVELEAGSTVLTPPQLQFRTANVGARAFSVAPSGRVIDLDTQQEVSPDQGFLAAVEAVSAITSGPGMNGQGSAIYFEPGRHMSQAAAEASAGFAVPSGDNDLNYLLIAGPNALHSARDSALAENPQPREPEATLARNWSHLTGTLVNVAASDVTVAGLEMEVEHSSPLLLSSQVARGGLRLSSRGKALNNRILCTLNGVEADEPVHRYRAVPPVTDPTEVTTLGIALISGAIAQGNHIRGLHTAVWLESLAVDVSDNLFENYVVGSFWLQPGFGTPTFVRNVFATQGVQFVDADGNRTDDRFGCHILLNVSGGFQFPFSNNDFYGQIPYDGSSPNYYNGVLDILKSGSQVVEPIQQGNYTPSGAFTFLAPFSSLQEMFFTPNSTTGTVKNVPGYVPYF